MIDRRMELSGNMTHELETPYGVATIYISHEGTKADVTVRNAGSHVVKTGYFRVYFNGNQNVTEWAGNKNAAGNRAPATWGYAVQKKQRHNMLVVVDALVLAWLKNHESDMAALKLASLRGRAWRMASSSEDYARISRKLADEALKLETPTSEAVLSRLVA